MKILMKNFHFLRKVLRKVLRKEFLEIICNCQALKTSSNNFWYLQKKKYFTDLKN